MGGGTQKRRGRDTGRSKSEHTKDHAHLATSSWTAWLAEHARAGNAPSTQRRKASAEERLSGEATSRGSHAGIPAVPAGGAAAASSPTEATSVRQACRQRACLMTARVEEPAEGDMHDTGCLAGMFHSGRRGDRQVAGGSLMVKS